MLNTILIDDELAALQALEHDLLNNFTSVNILAKCSSGKEGIKMINQLKPTLVFLDVDMPGMNGFEMLKEIDDIFFDVIFCTAHSKYAINAFRISAVIDYLSKPIKKEQLREAINRAEAKSQKGIAKDHFNVLIENLNGPSKIALRGSEGMDFISIDKIIYCQSNGNYITVHLAKNPKAKETYCTFTMKYIEEALPTSTFCRIHQSYLINLNFISKFNKGKGHIELENGEKLPVSKSGRVELIRKIGGG